MKNFIFIFIVLLLSSCASTQYVNYPATDIPVSNEAARIYVLRKSPFGLAVKMKVYEEEKLVGKLGSRSYLCWDVKEGDLLLISKNEKKDTMRINTKAGETYFIKLKLKMGIWRARTQLELLDKEEAKQLIAKRKKPKFSSVEK